MNKSKTSRLERKIKRLEMKVKANEYLNKYEQLSKATKYHIYFILDNKLYRTTTKVLDIETIIIDKEAKTRGNKEKLRMNISKKVKKEYLNNEATEEIMTVKSFERLSKNLGLNKGETCEYISTIELDKEYTRDNVRFDKAGDISLENGEEIQVKFQNASIAPLELIDRLLAK